MGKYLDSKGLETFKGNLEEYINDNTVIITDTLPDAEKDLVGEIYFYTGETKDGLLTNTFYQCGVDPVNKNHIYAWHWDIRNENAAEEYLDGYSMTTVYSFVSPDNITKNDYIYHADTNGELFRIVNIDASHFSVYNLKGEFIKTYYRSHSHNDVTDKPMFIVRDPAYHGTSFAIGSLNLGSNSYYKLPSKDIITDAYIWTPVYSSISNDDINGLFE